MIRRATPADGEAVGRVFLAARDEMAYLPRIPDADRPQLGGWILDQRPIWVAERDGRVVGFIGLDAGEVTHLYVEPASQGTGIGAALMEHVMALSTGGLHLWVFQRNAAARRFYERHGFRLTELTDGAGNMEREPDALYERRAENRHASGTAESQSLG
ncbi:MAG: N-acetyltransferase family protein [Gaiellaceae bacterium]